uniref:Uncharacterized protein n=1 Tax=uncultured prokaryote TaxID=198431 RepID=A0A0H5Q6P6_9ZZZZ|nr:hypothetical protein [uncultured prokaryote]
MYYGQNVISKNLIIANRKELLNGNGFVLGVSGSGLLGDSAYRFAVRGSMWYFFPNSV